ncbi:uncharacterized protein LOC121377195 [Gigantopelta aegis]|uniref:uncharacterized protein LOC121377195 n=1 Tax=Gigantopelta aegis TaxID=1735272 RepID=UPI001B8886CD|nr:uncharacterized protein LOC121377195 [Gigantopelta aegis]
MADFRFNKHFCGTEECSRTTDKIRQKLKSSEMVYNMCVSYQCLFKSAKTNMGTKRFKNECLQVICALRNSNGGSLVIHTYGKPDMAWSLDGFDQLVNEDCSMVIEDDTLYTDNYERKWFEELHDDSVARLPYLVIIVEPSSSISTYDFKTKVALDGAKVRPTARQIATYLCGVAGKKRKTQAESEPKFEEGKITNIYESRNVQLKRLSNEDIEEKMRKRGSGPTPSASRDVPMAMDIVAECFVARSLPEYLTTFSKLPGGGSFYCGINERKDTSEEPKIKRKKTQSSPETQHIEGTKTGENIIAGIELTEQQKQDLEKKLQRIITKKTGWYKKVNDGKYEQLDDDSILGYIDIKFHPTENGHGQGTDMGQGKRKYVIQVSVNSMFNGMVFYTDDSYPAQLNRPIPLSFRFSDEKKEEIVDTIEWFNLIEKAATPLER